MAIQQKMLLKQTGKLSPQQILEQEMLPLNVISMEQHIQKMIEENPALETDDTREEEDAELQQEDSFDEEGEPTEEEPNTSEFSINDEGEYEERLPPHQEYTPEIGYVDAISSDKYRSVYEYVHSKIAQCTFTKIEQRIADQIVGNLDEYGFLQVSEQDIVDHFLLYEQTTIALESVRSVRTQIQRVEPIGIASRNLEEYLSIQLQAKLEQSPQQTSLQHAATILKHYFHLLSAKSYEALNKKMQISPQALSLATHVIEHLKPYPLDLQPSSAETTINIVPDFSVFVREGIVEKYVHDKYIPRLHISKSFYELYKKNEAYKEKTKAFFHKDMQQAEFLIQAIKMRHETLTRIIHYIAKAQFAYFETGDESLLVPLLMKDIAQHSDRDISTVSRALSGKYIETDWGIKPAKFFIHSAVQNSLSGETTTHYQVEQHLKKMIEEEDKSAPYTDAALTELMEKEGYSFSRKTILSLREKLNIPPSKARKKI